jgi:hypothetical protein
MATDLMLPSAVAMANRRLSLPKQDKNCVYGFCHAASHVAAEQMKDRIDLFFNLLSYPIDLLFAGGVL